MAKHKDYKGSIPPEYRESDQHINQYILNPWDRPILIHHASKTIDAKLIARWITILSNDQELRETIIWNERDVLRKTKENSSYKDDFIQRAQNEYEYSEKIIWNYRKRFRNTLKEMTYWSKHLKNDQAMKNLIWLFKSEEIIFNKIVETMVACVIKDILRKLKQEKEEYQNLEFQVFTTNEYDDVKAWVDIIIHIKKIDPTTKETIEKGDIGIDFTTSISQQIIYQKQSKTKATCPDYNSHNQYPAFSEMFKYTLVCSEKEQFFSALLEFMNAIGDNELSGKPWEVLELLSDEYSTITNLIQQGLANTLAK